VTSEARPREAEVLTSFGPDGDDVVDPRGATVLADRAADDGATGTADEAADDGAKPEKVRRGRRGRRGSADGGSRLTLPLVPTLAVLLVLLLGGIAFLWLTRPETSAVRTGNYVEALQAARSGVVDLTSFDYLTLDDDIEQVRRVATGDLRDEAAAELDGRRAVITQAEAVVNTEVVGAGVTRADQSSATVLLVIQSTQESNTSDQAQVVRYRIEVELEKSGGRWLLSGIKGTGTDE
jgi:hypothetical protein